MCSVFHFRGFFFSCLVGFLEAMSVMKQGEREVSLAGAEGGCFQQNGLREVR